MPTWQKLFLALLAVVGLSLGIGALRALRNRRQLDKLFSQRHSDECLASCLGEFESIDPKRVRHAYAWVQTLVNYPRAPIRADDNLWTDLRIDQGETDDLFESSHEWRGDAHESVGPAPGEPPKTVRDLMAQLLWYLYEGYVSVLSRAGERDAA